MSSMVNIHEAKTHLSKLLTRVESGEEIVIARAGKPVARLVPVKKKAQQRTSGSAKGKVYLSRDFLKRLPEAILAEFEK